MISREDICKAIRNRKVISFRYQGLQRKAHPYACGLTKDRNPALRGFQVDGQSRSGPIPDGRLFLLRNIVDFRITDESFTPDWKDYRKNDKGMVTIFCQI
jgi:hypothetical protein